MCKGRRWLQLLQCSPAGAGAVHSSRPSPGCRGTLAQVPRLKAPIVMENLFANNITMVKAPLTMPKRAAAWACMAVAFMLPLQSMAQTTFYNDASCTVLCDGTNCGGAKFIFNPTPSSLQVGDCYKSRTDATSAARSVTTLGPCIRS